MDAPRNPAQEDAREPGKINRQNYTLRALRTLWSEAPALLFAALLFNLASLPAALAAVAGLWRVAGVLSVVFVAPAWLAMLAWMDAVVRGGAGAVRLPAGERPGAVFFFRSFVRFYTRAFVFGSVLYLAGWGLVVTLPAVTGAVQPGPAGAVALAMAAGFLFVYLVILSLYTFSMTAIYDQPLRAALLNSVVLSSRHVLPTLSLAMLIVMCAVLVLYVSSGLLFFLPALAAVFNLFTTYMVVEEETARQENLPPGGREP